MTARSRPTAGDRLRLSDAFLDRRGTIVLLEAVVVDKPRSQTFFVQLSQKDQAVTVRLLPAAG